MRARRLRGSSGKFDVIAPVLAPVGKRAGRGQPRERAVSGLSDPRFRLSVNFYGAPALTLAEYPAYKQDLVVGASVQVMPPWGQYDASKAVNLEPTAGRSSRRRVFEGVRAVHDRPDRRRHLFSRNDDYFGGQTLDQSPLYSAQANLSYDFGRGIWARWGDLLPRRTHDRRRRAQGQRLDNSRVGLTVAVPIDRYYSIKFNASSGISTRTGTNFDTVGLVLQYRWGAGL